MNAMRMAASRYIWHSTDLDVASAATHTAAIMATVVTTIILFTFIVRFLSTLTRLLHPNLMFGFYHISEYGRASVHASRTDMFACPP